MPVTRFMLALILVSGLSLSQRPDPNKQAKAISERLNQLRSLPDDTRALVTREIALQIRDLPRSMKPGYAADLANLATEGDFGRDTLQAVTTTLEQALRESPLPTDDGKPHPAYVELARLALYEHMQVSLDNPHY